MLDEHGSDPYFPRARDPADRDASWLPRSMKPKSQAQKIDCDLKRLPPGRPLVHPLMRLERDGRHL